MIKLLTRTLECRPRTLLRRTSNSSSRCRTRTPSPPSPPPWTPRPPGWSFWTPLTGDSTGGIVLNQPATNCPYYRFVPRHRDEIIIDIGDPVYVHVEAEDGWCEGEPLKQNRSQHWWFLSSGLNLRTGEKGIFPVAHVVDVDYNDFDPAGVEVRTDTLFC